MLQKMGNATRSSLNEINLLRGGLALSKRRCSIPFKNRGGVPGNDYRISQ